MKKLVFLALICLCLLMVPAASAVTFVDGNGNLVNIDAFGNVTLLSRGAAFAGSYTTAGCPVGVGYGTFTSRALVGSARIGGNSVTIINNQVPVVAQMPGSVAVAGRRGVAVADGLGGSVAVAGRRGGVAVSGGAGSVAVAGRRRGVAIAGGGGTAVAGRRRGVAIAR